MGFLINPFMVAPSGPTFFPSDIAGLIRWYKASTYNGAYADGNAITTVWTDNSTSLENATPQAGQEPLYKNTILVSGGSSVKMVDGFKHFDTTEMTLGDFSVVVFWRPNADAIVASSPSGNYQARDSTGGTLADTPSIFPNGAPTLDGLGAHNNQTFHIRTWTRNGTSGVPVFYWNKDSEAETGGDTNTGSMKISTVGLFNGGPGDFDIVEWLVYNTVLTQANVDNLYDNYFKLLYPLDL